MADSAQRLDTAETLVVRLQHENAVLRAELADLQADATTLRTQVGEITSLRRHVGRDVKAVLRRADARTRARLAPTHHVVPGEVADGDVGPGENDLSALITRAARADRRTFDSFAKQPTSSRAMRAYDRATGRIRAFVPRVVAGLARRLRRLVHRG